LTHSVEPPKKLGTAIQIAVLVQRIGSMPTIPALDTTYASRGHP
jgi:hypothetical protein